MKLRTDQQIKILVVEDSPTHAFHIRKLLESNGYTVKVVKDGQKAWDVLQHGDLPDLVISDIYMPQMDGYTLSQRIHEHPKINKLPVILITSFSDKMDIIHAMQSGAKYLLSRPFEESQLLGRIEDVLENKGLSQSIGKGQNIDLFYNGKYHTIQNDPLQTTHLLLSTFETTIQQSEEKKRLSRHHDIIFNSTQDAMFLVEVLGPDEFRYLQTNHAHQKASGISLEQIQGKTPQELVGEELGNKILSNYQKCLQNQKPLTYEETLDLPGGKRTWLTTLTPVIEEGVPSYIVGSGREITQQKKAEEALKTSSDELNEAHRMAKMGRWDYYHSENRVKWSDTVFELFEIKPDHFDAKYESALKMIHPNDRDQVNQTRFRSLKTRKDYEIEYRLSMSDGRIKWILEHGRTEFDPDGNPLQSTGIVQDITDRKSMEKELQESEERYKTVLGDVPAMICRFLPDTRIEYVNPAYCEYFGKTSEWLVGRSFLELIPVHQHDYIRSMLDSLSKESPFRTVTHQVIDPESNDMRIHQWTNRALFDPDGKIQSFQSIGMDVTEERKAQEALQSAHNRLITVMNSLDSTIYIADMDTHEVLFVNEAGRNRWGDLEGTKCWQSIQKGQESPCSFCPNANLLNPDGNPVGVYRWEHQNTIDGRWYDCRDRAIEWVDGRMVRMAVATDITEHKHAMEELIRSEKRFREFLQSLTTAAVQGYTSDGTVSYWNQASERIYGYTAEEAYGRNLLELIIPPSNRESVKKEIAHMMRTGEVTPPSEMELMRKDGSLIPVYSSHAIVRVPGQDSELFCLDIDLTAHKQVEEALREAKNQAQSASHAKSQFVSNMSHEIRTPLNGVIGFAELLAHTQMSSEQRTYLGYIASSAKNLLALVNDILDLSKIEAGKMELHTEAASVEEICKTVMDSVRHMAYTKNLSLSLNMDYSITHTMIETDGDRLRQVLLNLLGNAVKFTQEGRVTFSVSLEKPFGPDGYGEILFSVIDTGPGIDEKHRSRLFDDFYQVDSSDTRRYGGAGLGLAISQRILNLMGSRLDLVSQPGHGSTFSFLLKVKSLSKAHSSHRAASSEETHPHSDIKAQWKIQPHKILIVEDNMINQKLIKTLVKKHLPNASVFLAETGLEGVQQWKDLQPDLVLMDLLMPEMDGIEATKIIRTQETRTHTPIIALTAAAEEQDRKRSVQAGMDGYLTKPVAVEALMKEMEKWLG